MAAPSSWRIKKTPLGKRTEDSEGRIKAKLTKNVAKTWRKFLACTAVVWGTLISAQLVNVVEGKLEQPDLTHSVLLPVIPMWSSPYTQAQQLIHDAGSLPGQRIVCITQRR